MVKINHKENMKAALECCEPKTAVPIWELEFQAWDNVSGRHIILGKEFEKLTPKEQERALYNNVEIMLFVAKEMNYSALTGINRYWEVAPGVPSYYWLPEEARIKQNKLLKKYCESAGLMLVGVCSACIGIPSSSNYGEFCYKIFDAPEEIDELAKKTFERGMEETKRYRDMEYDVIVSASDIADNNGPFYNPEQMDRWVYPYLFKWAEEVKRMGMYSVLHSDGNLYPLLEDLANSELNAIQAIDPVAGMDIKQVKTQVDGRLCLCGNVDCGLLLNGPKEKIYETTRQILEECKQGGSLVLGASNAVVPETPAENYREMIRAWADYGQY